MLAAVPLACGLAASYGFDYWQGSCGALVGPLFASKCHARQLEYQLLFQTAGTALGALIAALTGYWLELRRRPVVPPEGPTRGDP
jgi:hypothetical protein